MSRKSDDDLFIERFKPIYNHKSDTHMWETYDDDLEFVKKHDVKFIWTLIEGDNGKLYLSKGWHIVNRFGYFVCTNPWSEKDRDYLWG